MLLLCQDCLDLLEVLGICEEWYHNGQLDTKIKSANASAPVRFVLSTSELEDGQKCRVCRLFSQYLRINWLKISNGEEEAGSRDEERTDTFKCQVRPIIGGKKVSQLYISLVGGAVGKSAVPFVLVVPEEEAIRDQSVSKSDIELAKGWLETCQETHPACSSQGTFFPTRVLDISQPENIKLQLSSNLPSDTHPRYMTLSHCWGKSMPLRLLQSNLRELQHKVPLETLSKTFREAIFVAQSLGAHYLWIDSLCIIQDSSSDWEKEAATMHQVYTYSLLNISATSSPDGYGGLYLSPSSVTEPFARVHVAEKECYLVAREMYVQTINSAPLNTRAWVVQERLLSPSNLHFTTSGQYWECKTASLSRYFPKGFPALINGTSAKRIDPVFDGKHLRELHAKREDESLHGYEVWNSVVSTYSKGNLTVQSDKLVALSGLAASLKPRLNDEYLAGLWRRHLPYQLLWYPPRPRKRIGKEYIAPSWSWASFQGEVWDACSVPAAIPGENNNEVQIEILEVKVELASTNLFGSVKSGHITLLGRLAFVQEFRFDIPTSKYIFNSDTSPDSLWNIQLGLDEEGISFTDPLEFVGDIFLLPIIDGNAGSMSGVAGLILRKGGEGDERGSFRRVGTFSIAYEETQRTVGMLESLCGGFGGMAGELGVDAVDDGDRGRRYKIVIV
ncbi:heterokaryon incompatibility protein-domain-containing protein [Halenospora varia]|nr:heterokaryon incompatibility protein-domain-containing protein [Halenospora varia]